MTTQLGSWVFNNNDSLSTHERPSEVGCEFLLEITAMEKKRASISGDAFLGKQRRAYLGQPNPKSILPRCYSPATVQFFSK